MENKDWENMFISWHDDRKGNVPVGQVVDYIQRYIVPEIKLTSRQSTLREIMTVVEGKMSKKLPLFHEECATGIKEMCDKCEAKKHFISGRVASCSDLLSTLQSLLSDSKK